MKKLFLILAALFVAGGAFAQATPTIGAYLDAAGSMSAGDVLIDPSGSMHPPFFSVYVVAFYDTGTIGGASFQVTDNFPAFVEVLSSTPAAGVQIGDPLDGVGVEMGLAFPQSGYFHAPVLLYTINYWAPSMVGEPRLSFPGEVCVLGHAVAGLQIADGTGVLYPADGLCLNLSVVPTEEETWGGVKSLFR
jgi:hypothetical protein